MLAALTALPAAHAADGARETVTPAFAYPITNVPGKSMTGLIVSYAPAVLVAKTNAKDLLTFDEPKKK